MTAVADEWLTFLYGHAGEGWLTLFSVDRTNGARHTDWYPLDTDHVAVADTLRPTCDTWHGVATRTKRLDNGRRGGDNDCHQIPGLWLDIDIAGPNHKTTAALPPDVPAALELVDAWPHPPTAVIHSGGGLQVWWLFDRMTPCAQAAPLLRKWGSTWVGLAAEKGWHLDNVFDMARIMRLPGTQNLKQENDPMPVRILERLTP